MKRIEIRLDDVTRVEAEITGIARDHPLGIPARGHGGEILRFEVLYDLRTNFYDIGDLLD